MTTKVPLVVVPALDEASTVGTVVQRVRNLGYPTCVIDDGSRDQTSAIAEAVGAVVLKLPVNLGIGGALRCGFRYALAQGHDTVVQVDADGQHNPADIPGLLEALAKSDADMVIGSRFLGQDRSYEVHPGRRLFMRLLARRASSAVGSPITDATSGFRAIRSPLLDFFADDYPVDYLESFEALVAAARRGARIAEHPITAMRRSHGKPRAGLVACGWYLIRSLAAASLVRSRTTAEPLARPASARLLRPSSS
jgi:glycosyltransferase involved in cell wall biosynthesis